MWSKFNTYAKRCRCKVNYQRLERRAVSLVWIRTDGTSDEGDQFLPVSVRHVDKDSGLFPTSLFDMPNIKNGTTLQQMYDFCNEAEAFSLDWDNCVTYSSDNTNSITG